MKPSTWSILKRHRLLIFVGINKKKIGALIDKFSMDLIFLCWAKLSELWQLRVHWEYQGWTMYTLYTLSGLHTDVHCTSVCKPLRHIDVPCALKSTKAGSGKFFQHFIGTISFIYAYLALFPTPTDWILMTLLTTSKYKLFQYTTNIGKQNKKVVLPL